MFIFRRYGLPLRDFDTVCIVYICVLVYTGLYTIPMYTCMLYTFVHRSKSLFGSPRLLSVLQKKLKRGIYQKISPAGVLEKRFIEFCPTRINLSANVVVVFMGDNNDLNLIRRGCMIFDLLSKSPVVFKILQTIQIVKPTLFHR